MGTPVGIDAFFADAGQAIEQPSLPETPPSFDRGRLHAAFAKHGLTPFTFLDDPVPTRAAR